MHDGDDATNHALERMVFFSDAVFAIVITLLVLEIHIPHLGRDASNDAWGNALIGLLPHFGAFLLSFMVIGALWVSHHKLFMMLACYNERLLWPNLHLLLAVAFLPFSTSLLAMGSLSAVPYAFYGASLLAAALAKARLVAVALQPDLLRTDVTAADVATERRRRWIMPIAALATTLLAFVTTPFNTLAMLLLPVLKRTGVFRAPVALPDATTTEDTRRPRS